MQTLTFDQASKDLKNIIMKTVRDKEEIVIASNDGAVVLLCETEWERIKETLRLLSDRRSLDALIDSHQIRDRGQKPEGLTPEDAFNDL